MQVQSIVFRDILKFLPWDRLEALTKEHGSDKPGQELTTKRHLLALLYAQLSGISGLRELVECLESHASLLYGVGGGVVKRSTLADANRYRTPAVFSDLLAALMDQAHRGLRRAMAESVHLIDATVIPLNQLSGPWAHFSTGVYGAKLHVVYDPNADCPLYAVVSGRAVNDITPAQTMPVHPGATYVFDLGYYDYAWWARLHDAGCRLVTRLKTNTPIEVVEIRSVEADGAILSDQVGFLPKRQAKNRKNPFSAPVREVRILNDAGKLLRLLTNDLKASAQEIADLYKRRWAIELFFRWIKQNLRIRKFMGTSENAVRIQIAVALVAFLLLRLVQAALRIPMRPITFARLVQRNLMQRRRIDQLRTSAHAPSRSTHQIGFQWSTA